MGILLFVLVAALALAGGVGVIASRRPVHSALALLLVLGSLAVDYLLLDAQFIAVLQVMISATVSFTQPVRPEAWRRYATILLDGVCRRRDQPTPLTESVLDDDELHLVMHGWPRDRRAAHPDEGCAEDKHRTQA